NPVSGRSFPAGRPGGSNHGHGRAIDFLSSPPISWLRAHAGQYGLETIPGAHPPIHLQGARGNVGPRPSAQEQQTQRTEDAQNRQTAIDRGLIPGGRSQQAAVPLPRGRPSDAPAPSTPSVIALPPQEAPQQSPDVPRPPADIPAPALNLVPPAQGRADPLMQTRQALDLINQSLGGLSSKSGQAEFNAAGVIAAKAMAAAGVPLSMARSLLTRQAYAGAEKVGYGPSANLWSIYKSYIDAGINAALQGYHPARPGEVQGPPSPAQQRSSLGSFFTPVAGARDIGGEAAIPGQQQLPGRAEWEAPLEGGMAQNLDPFG